jgi:hypothetical protein
LLVCFFARIGKLLFKLPGSRTQLID